MQTTARPLYVQVREALTSRIADGLWKAGAALPSEFALAAELGVSQGTVRKALDSMAADHLVERQQGRGTFVPEHTEARALFHFFKMRDAAGAPILPQIVSQSARMTTAEVFPGFDGARHLWQISRVRAVHGKPAMVEHVFVSPDHFTDLTEATALPNALYAYYQSTAGISIARAEDRLMAVPAPTDVAKALALSPGTPLLKVDRTAYDLRDRVIELRHSWFDTTHQSYAASLR
ncbi:MAG: GntR family transcriptional regulator [Pseudomonadota bacterium]